LLLVCGCARPVTVAGHVDRDDGETAGGGKSVRGPRRR
jgi:hypothetical protein